MLPSPHPSIQLSPRRPRSRAAARPAGRPRPGRSLAIGLSLGLGLITVLASSACPGKNQGQGPDSPNPLITDTTPAAATTAPSLLQKKLAATTPARPLPPSDTQKRLSAIMDQYFQNAATRRLYVHVDKPMYQPGETVWFRVWELATPTLVKGPSNHGVTIDLISPKGASVMQKRIQVQDGVTTNDFALPGSVQGGEYTIRARSDLSGMVERNIIVSQYQPPRIKKKVEFLRKAYGPGDKVVAALSLNRATGEPLTTATATAVVTVDEIEVSRSPLRLSAEGKGMVRFDLPVSIRRGDGLLTVLVDDGGVTESLQKRIPIVLKEMQVELFPEGGDLVEGLPGRVYFMAKNLIGKPADIEGRVVDGKGTEVARFASLHNGLGRFELTPAAGATYFVEITRPTGIGQRIPVPAAKAEGCTMMSVDDTDNQRDDVRVGVWCSRERTVIATAVLREKRLGEVSIDARPQEPTVVSLPVAVGSQGAVRVTVMSEELQPLAERLIYRGRGQDLKVSIKSDRVGYAPRDAVELTVETKDLRGKPVQADLALAVVDDTVLDFADDKKAHLLARLYLESEMPGQEIEEPNFYFSDDPKAASAMDLVLGTQGWRRFDWQMVLAPPPPVVETTTTEAWGRGEIDDIPMPDEAEPAMPMRKNLEQAPPMAAKPMAKPVMVAADKAVAGKRKEEAQRGPAFGRAARARDMNKDAKMDRRMAGERLAEEDRDWAGADLGDELANNRWSFAPVRVFPVPNYEARYDGPRVDFRETIYWQSSVKTDSNGTAKVRFYASDAVTSFRATAEGVSLGGLPGRGDTLIKSKLPVSLAVTMPLEVSRGDLIKLPVTLENETERAYDVNVTTQFGAAFRVRGGIPATVTIKGGQRRSFFAELEVVGDGKDAAQGKALVAIDTSNLRDEVEREIKVVALGFPQEVSLAGTLQASANNSSGGKGSSASHEINLAGVLPGSIEATINLYPSPLATMVKGTEAMIREPYGCFEQASSANYPNIMVLAYLEQNNAADPAIVERAMGMLDRGYKKLTGYESPKQGYEWFGGDPGHEALTAYGLMEFADMSAVYGDVDRTMIERTKSWLKSRRDGKGGFQRNTRALDSFGSAGEEVTNSYITYALSEAGEVDLAKELAYQKNLARETKDPYVMALASNVLVNLEPQGGATASALDRLQGMQKPDGSFAGADHSITRSGGQALTIESTSLAALAFIRAKRANTEPVRRAISWLNQNRNGSGGFGSTQSTVLSLRAMTAYADATRATEEGGTVSVLVNGKEAGRISFDKGHKDTLVFDDIAALLGPGKNRVELRLDTEQELPYSVAISYRSKMPASDPKTAVAMSTTLNKSEVPMGEGVRMKVTIKNLTDKGIPMTLARVGLPGGLTFQNWQLDELKDKKLIDFYETREREVVLYFRSMAPNAVADIDLDLIARVPGEFVAPASRAYLYYTDELKHWAEPVRVTVQK